MSDAPIELVCSICGSELTEAYNNYPHQVCRKCDSRTLNSNGDTPEWNSMADGGDNPVFIDGFKCWRRYRFGGYITIRDTHDCEDERKFFEQYFESSHTNRMGSHDGGR